MSQQMTVLEALAARHSVRAFTPDPVSRQDIEALIEVAAQTPSWANTQPWEVFVATGDTLARIKAGYKENYANGVATSPETPPPTTWSKAALERIKHLSPDMKRDCGEEAAENFHELNRTLFDAPAVMFLCMDEVLSQWSLYDIGAYTQSIMLAATHFGLGTIPAITLTFFPEVIRKEMGIPDNLKITIGIAIGHTDEDNRINDYKSARKSLDETLRFFE